MKQLRRLEPAIVQEVQATPTEDVRLAPCSVVSLIDSWSVFQEYPGHLTARKVTDIANRLRCLGVISAKECADIQLKLSKSTI